MFSPPKRVEFMERRPLGLACGTGANGCRLDHMLCEHPVDERSLAPERVFPQRQNPISFAGPEKARPSLPAFSFVLSGGGPRLYLITGIFATDCLFQRLESLRKPQIGAKGKVSCLSRFVLAEIRKRPNVMRLAPLNAAARYSLRWSVVNPI